MCRRWVWAYKAKKGCQKCGEKDPLMLVWTSGLGRNPFKVEIVGSNPTTSTGCHRAPNKLIDHVIERRSLEDKMKRNTICFCTSRGMEDPNEFSESKKQVIHGWVDIKKLPKDLNVEANVRSQRTSPVFKAIEEGLRENPDNFHWNNKGITITAHSFKYFKTKDNENCYDLLFIEEDIHGVIDGGHTYRAIVDNFDELDHSYGRFVKVEILVGFGRSEIIDLIEARNKTKQVKEQSLADKRNQYEIIKQVLRTIGLPDDKVKFEENDNSDVNILDIVSYMYMFDITRFDGINRPVEAFNRTSAVHNDYINNFDKEGNIKNGSYYSKTVAFLNEMIPFANYVNSIFCSAAPGNYGNYTFAKAPKKGAKFWFDGDRITKHKVPKALFWPIIGAFSALIEEDANGNIKWSRDPKTVFAECGPDLIKIALETCKQNNGKLTPTGKDPNLWRTLYSTVKLYK